MPCSIMPCGSSSVSVVSTMRKRAMSSLKISVTDSSIQRSPKCTRGLSPRSWKAFDRVSMEYSKTAIRVSCHSRLPSRIGELTAAASNGAVMVCAML